MTSLKMPLVVLVASVSALLAAPASAVVTNVTTGETLFFDNFEGLGSAVSHAGLFAGDGDFNPTGGSPGHWTIVTEPAPDRIQVTDATGVNGPGAAEGTNYLRFGKFPGGSTPTFSATFVEQQTPGDHIHYEQMVYVVEPNGVQLLGNSTGTLFNLIGTYYNGPGSIVSEGTPGGIYVVPLTFTPDKWQKWEIDYNTFDSVFKLTIDGVSASDIPMKMPGMLHGIHITTDAYGYIDEVFVPVPPPMPDINMDGVVNIFDINLVSANWGGTGPAGDANKDGIVNIFDINLISANWTPAGGETAVPEPSTTSLLGIGLGVLAIWRLRRRKEPASLPR